MNAKDVSAMTGVSVRTLHHYDQIGLLCPQRNDYNRYREYSEANLDKLQQILFFKECGFSLKKIKSLLDNPAFDKRQVFAIQEKYLMHEKKRIELMLDTLHKTIKAEKGELIMSQKDKFNGFDLNQNPYEAEARERWGDEAVAHINTLSKEEKSEISGVMGDIFTEFAQLRYEQPESKIVQTAIEKLYHYLNKNFEYHYSMEAFAGLGRMYVEDERFTKNIDRFGDGLSKFLAESMEHYVKTH